MAEEAKKGKSDMRYGGSPKMKGGKVEKAPAAKGADEAAATAGDPKMTDTGDADPGPAATDAAGTAGIDVHARHATERAEMSARQDKERSQMNSRHETDHKKMADRHVAEMDSAGKTSGDAKAAGEKADATKADLKEGT